MIVTARNYVYEYTFAMSADERMRLVTLIRMLRKLDIRPDDERLITELLSGLDVRP